jgi:phenylalanyl-tRNA synthetase beta chain
VLDAPDAVPRFSGRVIRGVNARAATPDWMRQRLERSRPALDLGAGRHHELRDARARPTAPRSTPTSCGAPIDVRFAAGDESLELLNGQTVDPRRCLADRRRPRSDRPRRHHGRRDDEGGSRHHRTVFLEAAFFFPDAIAGRARRYNFGSRRVASLRAWRRFRQQRRSIERATRLILDICGGEAGPLSMSSPPTRFPSAPPVRMRVARARKVIGVAISAGRDGRDLRSARTRVRVRVVRRGRRDIRRRTPPSYRFDLEIEEDLIEEIARVYGFDRIPALPPRAPAVMRASPNPGVR